MNDPAAARTEPAKPRRAPERHPRPEGRRRHAKAAVLVRAALIATGLVTVYYVLPLDGRSTGTGTTVLLACGLLLVVLVFWWEVQAIAHSPFPRLKAVEALAATLVLFVLLFAGTYFLLEHSSPGSFSEPLTKTDSLYFTLTTFTTVGYGDIVARSQTGRVLTMCQMMGGLLLVGVAARILAGAVQTGLRRRGHEPTEDFPSRRED
ncbi:MULTISPECIES: potassium channel family protein [Streptomyces]|uniref:Two pore domain potassium channel family protein n=1 Tax=Streptomyces koelreuteriae TaxID=2838015 RepID=A0ABX8FLR5_9ACTN|nr:MULTISPECIES: potassium channel family protein [Streptomyces]QWB22100.1 two pore domain potassium channel family protein [Streptomyces koelreuteriae]UUA05037.1 potassium channel family protein [Streptomyces koelreuteriae]UUA12661.1 potassium channel family protein [Streptomyces sp. CRCS-T-1]